MIIVSFIRDLNLLIHQSWRRFTILSAITLLECLSVVPGPLLYTWLLTLMLEGLQIKDIIYFAVSMITLELVSSGLRIFRTTLNRNLAIDSANRLRHQFFDHLIHLPYGWFLEHQSGGQANSWLNDIDEIDASVSGIIDRGLRSILLMLCYGLTLFIWNPILALGAFSLIPLTLFAQRQLRSKVRSYSRDKVDLRESLLSKISEAVTNISLIKSQSLELYWERLGDKISSRYATVAAVMETRQSALRSLATVLLIFSQFAFFIAGGVQVIYGTLSLAHFLGQVLLISRLVGPMAELMDYTNALSRSQASLHRVMKILALPREDDVTVKKTPLTLNGKGMSLACNELQFRFHSSLPLIESWNFRVQPGERIAIVGPSGSGKTTLFHLILGLHQGYQGEILLNGQSLHHWTLDSRRQAMGVVFQEQQLFNASIRENLSLDRTYTDEQLWRVLANAHALEFVESLSSGLDSRIGVDGVKLSGGQRQRIAIAQAILRDPPLLLLDEATSALDTFSEIHIQAALDQLMASRTSLVIAHRLSTVVHADRILVINHGRIVEEGSHQELMQRQGLYSRLCKAQSSGFIDWDQIHA